MRMLQGRDFKVFLNYRRQDSMHQTGRIHDRLEARFGTEAVFKDVDSIPLGVDFRAVLAEKVQQCHVLLAVIGDHWLTADDDSGHRRLDDPADFVRIEVEMALARDIPVIPLLVGAAPMPKAEQLPDSLRALAFRNGLAIRPDPDFRRDMERLIGVLEQYAAGKVAAPKLAGASNPLASLAGMMLESAGPVLKDVGELAGELVQLPGTQGASLSAAPTPAGEPGDESAAPIASHREQGRRRGQLPGPPSPGADPPCLSILEGHSEEVYAVAYSPDGLTIASASQDNTVRLWDARTGQHRATLTGHTGGVRAVAYSPDGLTLASGAWDGTVRLWDARTGDLKATLDKANHRDRTIRAVFSVTFSPDGLTLAIGSGEYFLRQEGELRLWDARAGKHRATLSGHTGWVRSVALSPDGHTLASGSKDLTVRLWDARTGELKATLTGHMRAVYAVAFSPGGELLASGS